MSDLYRASNTVASKRFSGSNRGTKACYLCGKVTWAEVIDRGTGGTDLCAACSAECMAENQHSDHIVAKGIEAQRVAHKAHDADYAAVCPTCWPEKIDARRARDKAAAAAKASKAAEREAARPRTIRENEYAAAEVAIWGDVASYEAGEAPLLVIPTNRWFQARDIVDETVNDTRWNEGKASKVKNDDRWTRVFKISPKNGIAYIKIARHRTAQEG